MVTPEELLDLARQLGNRTDEPARRAAVSLAYYATYHHFRILIGRGSRASDHARVAGWLRRHRPYAAYAFGALREERIAADYLIEQTFDVDVRASCAAAGLLLEVT